MCKLYRGVIFISFINCNSNRWTLGHFFEWKVIWLGGERRFQEVNPVQSKDRLSRGWLLVLASHLIVMLNYEVSHGKLLVVKTLPVCSDKNLQVPAPLWIWPEARDRSVLAFMALDIIVSLTWQYDPNCMLPSTFASKGSGRQWYR